MQGFGPNVDGYYDVEDQLPRYLRRLAERQFARADAERARLTDAAAVERRRDRARERFFESLGGLPDERTPLNPRVTGTLDRDGYAVELVVFESLPGFHVTANCYVPDDVSGEAPGVLFFCGHADVGKAASLYQQACVELAREGFVTLAVDPVGQGERHQFHDPETGETPRRNVIEHSYLGHQCQLAGTNVARYFVWDAIRAFDYLAGRPEVDESRVGVTGNSGGGTQTGYLILADDRPAAAAPCCFVTSKEDYMKTGQAQDGEQILWRAIETGPRYDDFLTGFAPKPVLVGASQSDFLCVEGAHRTYDRALAAYERFDAGDAVDLVVSDSTHGLGSALREAVVNWFRVHLQGRTPEFETRDPDVEDVETLHCVEAGEVNAAFPDERHVFDLTRERVRALGPETAADVDGDDYAAAMRARVRERFDLDREACRRFPRVIEREEEGDLVWEKVFFRSEADVVVTGVVARDPDVDPATALPTLVLLERGTESLDEYRDDVAAFAADRGAALVFDPRGVGGVRARDVNTPLANGGEYYDYHGTEYKLASDALMLGTSLVALRTFDVCRAVGHLRERFGADKVGVVGAGSTAFHALYAAVADPSVRSVLVDDVPAFHERATAEETEVDHGLTAFGVVGSLDVPQLLPALADREVTRTVFPEGGLPPTRE